MRAPFVLSPSTPETREVRAAFDAIVAELAAVDGKPPALLALVAGGAAVGTAWTRQGRDSAGDAVVEVGIELATPGSAP